LDDARDDVKRQPVPSSTSKEKKSSTPLKLKRNPRILHQLNEYIFDLFDANCLEDFKKMEEFEKYALDAFMDLEQSEISSIKEFNHRQYELHQEFLTLFETLIDKFLKKFDYTMDELYEQIEWYYKQRDIIDESKASSHNRGGWKEHIDSDEEESSPSQEAFEIIEVITFYTDFEKWTTMMMEIVKQRKHFETFKARMSKAVHVDNEFHI